jgi:cytoskeleton protein RodZ
MDVGSELRQTRERQGLSLQQISNSTKVSLRVLQAIEASDESRLPAPVFTRSFVKTYAALIGLEPDETSRRYFEQFVPLQTAPTPEPPREATEPTGRFILHGLQGRFGTVAVLFLVGLTAFALAARNARRARSGAPALADPAIVSAAGLSPARASQPAAVGTSGQMAAPPQSLHLTIAPTGPCWVRATVDGESVVAKLLTAGDRREVDVRSDITLRVGDPSTFAFSIDGVSARVPGPPGQAVTVHLTKENYRQFLTR